MTDRAWGPLPDIDPDPNAPMCGVVNGKIICCRSQGHEGRHATPFPSLRRHGPVWVYWIKGGPFGTCHHNDPATHLYCGLERGHEGDHLSPSNQGPGATLAEWTCAPEPAPESEGKCDHSSPREHVVIDVCPDCGETMGESNDFRPAPPHRPGGTMSDVLCHCNFMVLHNPAATYRRGVIDHSATKCEPTCEDCKDLRSDLAALRAAGTAVVEAYADCRARGSFAGFWTHVDDLSKALGLEPCPVCDGPFVEEENDHE